MSKFANHTNTETARNAYLIAFDNFETTPQEIADELDISAAEAREALDKLVEAGIVVKETVNGIDDTVWQCLETYDSVSREDAETIFDVAFGAETDDESDEALAEYVERTHATGPRYTEDQLKAAYDMRQDTDLSWRAIAIALEIKTPYRLAKKVKAKYPDVRTEKALIAKEDPKAKIARLEALLVEAVNEKRTSGPLKAKIREELGL